MGLQYPHSLTLKASLCVAQVEDWGRKPHNQDVENYFNIKGKKVVQIKYSPKNSSTQIKKDVIAQFQRN